MSLRKKFAIMLAFACFIANSNTNAFLEEILPSARLERIYQEYKTPIQLALASLVVYLAYKVITAKKPSQSVKASSPLVKFTQKIPVQPKTQSKPLSTTPTEFVRNYNLPILHKDARRPIYQVRSAMDLGGWTCGFFTLKNASDLESLLGISRPRDIKQLCNNYINNNGINPFGAITNKQIIDLSDDVIGLNNFYLLTINPDNNVGLDHNKRINWHTTRASYNHSISAATSSNKHRIDITIEAPCRTTNAQIDTVVRNTVNNELHTKLVNLKQIFTHNPRAILNFGCWLNPFEKHVFLVSVLQLSYNNRVVLVYDNVNKLYTDSAPRNKFVNAIYDIFCTN